MRKQSMWNYYIHMYFVFICFEVSRQISVPLSANITFAIVSIAVFILSMVIVVITNRGYCVWLNKLVK
jgi:hypothetical protein